MFEERLGVADGVATAEIEREPWANEDWFRPSPHAPRSVSHGRGSRRLTCLSASTSTVPRKLDLLAGPRLWLRPGNGTTWNVLPAVCGAWNRFALRDLQRDAHINCRDVRMRPCEPVRSREQG